MSPTESIQERARRVLSELAAKQAGHRAAPVSVAEIEELGEGLDDHLWLRVAGLVREPTPAGVAHLSNDVSAYYLTRLFEWDAQHDGPDAFFDHYPDLVGVVAAAYRHLGLAAAADAYEALVNSVPALALRAKASTLPSGADLAELARLTEAVGWNQSARLQFVHEHASSLVI